MSVIFFINLKLNTFTKIFSIVSLFNNSLNSYELKLPQINKTKAIITNINPISLSVI